MKTASLIAAALLLLCWLVQYIYSRRYKREFDVFYRRYTQQGHFVPAHVAIADGLGSLGTSIKVQWFRWILCGKKIKVKKNQYLPAKTYEFVRLSSSERLQTWMKNNGTLLALEGLLFIMALIFMLIARMS
ncbi:hypothetical protein CMV60_21565 [Serratia marcescens]|nr:hypothetical protein CMV60_21565 [Serratia marcescens]